MKFLKISGVVIVILSIAIYIYSDYFIEQKLKVELTKIINTDSLNYYNFSLDELDLSIVTGSITIKGVKIEPTQIALDSLQSSSNNVRVLVSFSCKRIKIKSLEIKHFLRTRELLIEKFIIDKPNFVYSFNSNKKSNSKTLGLNNLFSDSFKKAKLKQFVIDNADIKIRNIAKEHALVHVENFSFKLTDAVVDTTTINRFSPFDYSNIEFSANSLKLNISKDFEIFTGTLQFNAEKNATIITNFKLTPTYGQEKFSRLNKVQRQWVAISLDTFRVVDIHFEKLIQQGFFEISKITLTNANVGLYKDKSKPEPPFKKQLLPASALRTMEIDLSIDTIEVKKSRVVINEKSSKTRQLSYLSFEDLNVQIYGFTNDSDHLSANKYLSVYAQTKVMNAAKLNFEAHFDLLSTTDLHTIKAQVGSSEMKVFNKVLEPMMSVVVKFGNMISLNYQYTANDTEANGTLDFEYENVKLEVLSEGAQAKKQGFMSLAANTVIKSNNRKENQKNYTLGIIKAQRIQDKNIFPFLWHSVQSGIIYTMAPAFSDIKKEEKKANKKNWFKKK